MKPRSVFCAVCGCLVDTTRPGATESPTRPGVWAHRVCVQHWNVAIGTPAHSSQVSE